MQRARSVLLILLLLAGSLSPPAARAQDARSARPPPAEQARPFSLEQNYPNPVNPETWIPFSLEESLFQGRDSVVVTLRIYNVLRQVVAIPKSVDHPTRGQAPLFGLPYRRPGRHLAYWDGKDPAGRRLPSGVYYCQMVVNDQPEPSTRKIIVLNERRRRGIIPWFGRH